GNFQWKVMLFGGAGAPAACNKAVNLTIRDIPQCQAYFDDIIIGGKTKIQLIQNFIKLIKKLKSYNLHLRLEKCQFGDRKLKYLGFIITNKGIEIDQNHKNKIINFVTPKTIKQVQQFCGVVNYLGKFIPYLAE